ncbi:ABC transporter ATP-binding protein [Candidatus Saccharibacteria bacterium]|nr:ABC transporter ATP-binding protein [Candidatus Saccharibacteria bacterium]
MTKDITTKQILKFHWGHAMKFKRQVVTSFVVAPLTIIFERYVTPIIIAIVLSQIQAGTVTLESSIWLIAGYAVLQVLTQIIGYRVNLYAAWEVQVRGARDIYRESYEKLTHHSLDFYNDNFAGSLVSKVNKFGSAFNSFWQMIIFEMLFIVTSIIATIVGISFLIWQYAIVLAILVVVFIIAAFYGTRFMRPRQKARSKAYTKISAQLSDSISNIFAVKIDSKERYEQKRLDTSIDDMLVKEFRVRSGIMTDSPASASVTTLMRISALVASIWAVQHGIADAAVMYLCFTYTFNLIQEIWNISSILRNFYQITGDSEEMLEILNQPIGVKDTSTKSLKAQHGTLSITDLTFTHDGAKSALFDQLSLSIPAGQKVGIVGISGSGKTTLTKLLLRFVDPASGAIAIDNQNIAKVSQTSLHDAIAYVPQEPLLFHRSIAENISYGNPGASLSEIKSAAKKAHADTFINELAEGYETLVGERGVKLSGGQRQRVAIARAILKDAPILILDEATSALDSESEKLIQDALEKLMKHKTSIVIAHRLSTIATLDRIIVLDKGTIVEDGTHTQLLENNSIYASLWSHQSGGFIDAED